MSDIVERLRVHAVRYASDYGYNVASDLDRAANEIERLRREADILITAKLDALLEAKTARDEIEGFDLWDEIERLRELLQEARGHIDHIRWHGFPENTSAPAAKEKAAQMVEKIDLAFTDEQLELCEHGNHLHSCTVCLMWCSLPTDDYKT